MATTKDYKMYLLEQLDEVEDLMCRSMMGEYLLYSRGVLFGGIYDNRLLIKKVSGNQKFLLEEQIPYPGAKAMYYIQDIENKEKTKEIIEATVEELATLKRK